MKHDIPASKLYYGNEASSYDAGRIGNPVTEEDDKMIHRFIKDASPNSTFADIPCGTGRALIAVISSGHKYKGADISKDMLNECFKKLAPDMSVELEIADARELPWHDKSCDYLLSFKFIKWLPSDEHVFEVLKEFRRVCKVSALVNVKLSKTKPEYSWRELKDKWFKLIDLIKFGTTARSMKRENFEVMCERAGWKIVSIYENNASNGIVFNYILR